MNLLKTIKNIIVEKKEPEYAVIQILPALSYMNDRYRFQLVPYLATQRDLIYINKGSSGHKSISTKNIKIIDTGNKEKMETLLKKMQEEGNRSAKWIKCKNCKQRFTQTIHKGKKSKPICPVCGTHNTEELLGINESEKVKPHGYWTIEKISEEIEKYKTLNNFIKSSPSAYKALMKFGREVFEEKTKNLSRHLTFYSKEELADIAKRFRTRIDFARGDRKAYNQALRKGREFFDQITAHMERIGNLYKRYVYTFEFSDNTAYAGLAKDPKERYVEHMFKGPVRDYMIKTGLVPKFEIKTSTMIDAEDAALLEKKIWNEYLQRGWNVLNKVSPGGLGGRSDYKWTDDLLNAEVAKYSTLRDFMVQSPNAYKTAHKRGKEYFQNLTKDLQKVYTRQTLEQIIKELQNYPTLEILRKKNDSLYNKLSRRKLLFVFYPKENQGKLETNVDLKNFPNL